jgi:hypothetical protein
MTRPLPVLRVDLSRFTSAGHGTVHGAAADGRWGVARGEAIPDGEA